MTSGVLLTRARLLVASVLAVSIPVVLFAACRVIIDCPVIPCVKTCGGPVVTEVECECPEGLIDGTPLTCGTSCDDPAPWEGCGSECPEGLIDLSWKTLCGIYCDDHAPLQFCGACPEGLYDLSVNELVDCVELCGGPSVAQACSPREPCPPGSFESNRCQQHCESQLYVCVDHCGGEGFDVRCWPCSDGLIDQTSCLADGG